MDPSVERSRFRKTLYQFIAMNTLALNSEETVQDPMPKCNLCVSRSSWSNLTHGLDTVSNTLSCQIPASENLYLRCPKASYVWRRVGSRGAVLIRGFIVDEFRADCATGGESLAGGGPWSVTRKVSPCPQPLTFSLLPDCMVWAAPHYQNLPAWESVTWTETGSQT